MTSTIMKWGLLDPRRMEWTGSKANWVNLLLTSVTERDFDQPLTSRTQSRWPGTFSGQIPWSLPLNQALPAWNGQDGTGVQAAGKPWRSPLWWPLWWRRAHRNRLQCRSTDLPPALWLSGDRTRTEQEGRRTTKASRSADNDQNHRVGPC